MSVATRRTPEFRRSAPWLVCALAMLLAARPDADRSRSSADPEASRPGAARGGWAALLILGGELHNSSASSLEYMRPIWPRLVAMHFNTVLAPVSWELVERALSSMAAGWPDGG